MISAHLLTVLREQGFAKLACEVAAASPRGVSIEASRLTGHLIPDLGLAVQALGTKMAMDYSDEEVIQRGLSAYRRVKEEL